MSFYECTDVPRFTMVWLYDGGTVKHIQQSPVNSDLFPD